MTNGPTQEVLDMGVDIDTALVFHLTSRMYPPVHHDFHPAIRQAIDLANSGDWGETVDLPNGRTLTAAEVVDQLRLDPFITGE